MRSVGSSLSTPLLICVWQTKFIQHCWLNSKKSLKCEILTLNCFSKMAKRELVNETPPNAARCCCRRRWRNRDLMVASTRHHRARLLKYYLRPPYVPSFVKSRIFCPLQTHFLLFQQIFFVLVCIHAGTPAGAISNIIYYLNYSNGDGHLLSR